VNLNVVIFLVIQPAASAGSASFSELTFSRSHKKWFRPNSKLIINVESLFYLSCIEICKKENPIIE
jgi:hypothetical protein